MRQTGFRRPRPARIALVGADGAGKSTISSMLEGAELPYPVKRIYMGVNLDASTDMLPTTRLLVAARRVHRRLTAGMTAPLGSVERSEVAPHHSPPHLAHQGGSDSSTLKSSARLVTWMVEEWLRQLLAVRYTKRGYVVVFDRHFFADYHTDDLVVRNATARSPLSGFHRWMLDHVYPRPDLVICLDAPAEVLRARKQEDTLEWLEARRRQYLALRESVPDFSVVDATRPLDAVYTDVLRAIDDHHRRSGACQDTAA